MGCTTKVCMCVSYQLRCSSNPQWIFSNAAQRLYSNSVAARAKQVQFPFFNDTKSLSDFNLFVQGLRDQREGQSAQRRIKEQALNNEFKGRGRKPF